MATLDRLKESLQSAARGKSTQPLTDELYDTAFKLLLKSGGWQTYEDFIHPELTRLFDEFSASRSQISVLEVGPGPRSVLETLPDPTKISKYVAFEPNEVFADRLEGCFENMTLRRTRFDPDKGIEDQARLASEDSQQKFDLILFCHSMYGMSPKRKYIENTMNMLADDGNIVVFHRAGLDFEGLTCHRTASWPTGHLCLEDKESLDLFASFIAGSTCEDDSVRDKWRDVCCSLGRQSANSSTLWFSAPEMMVVFNQHASSVSELSAVVPQIPGNRPIKNREVQNCHPAKILKPMTIEHVQICVRWALESGTSLTVLGGGHSGHCVVPNTIAVDMSAFRRMEHFDGKYLDHESFIYVGSGCQSEQITEFAASKGLTIPLGSRPSVGAGLWLQGGIGHLSRLYGLTCDLILGAVVFSVESGEILCLGHVPEKEIQRIGAICPPTKAESEMLWALRGAGTNFGIVIGVTPKAFIAPKYSIQNWTASLDELLQAEHMLTTFEKKVSRQLPSDSSADVYLYVDKTGSIQIGVTTFAVLSGDKSIPPKFAAEHLTALLGPEKSTKVTGSVDLFEADMNMSAFGGEQDGGKTSSFKRCIFLQRLRGAKLVECFITALKNRPTELCYLHLLHGDGAIGEVPRQDTAFGCRDRDFACVITGVWPRKDDDSEVSRSVVRWVYDVAMKLLPLSHGVYSADLGPDPRDAALAVKAFGPNRARLARLKRKYDPQNVLAYACPLPKPRSSTTPKLVVIVTGMHGHGKDYTAELWASYINNLTTRSLQARVTSIIEVTKRKHAVAQGADIHHLLHDRAYEDKHRQRLTAFWNDELEKNPELPKEYFRACVNGTEEADIVFVTGLTEQNPVAVMASYVPDCRLIEVSVRLTRQDKLKERSGSTEWESNTTPPTGLVFNNDSDGNDAAKRFIDEHLPLFFHDKLERLQAMVSTIPNFPASEVNFRHILGIAEHREGLSLTTDLLQKHCAVDWSKTDAIVSCEAGGFIFASALASRLDLPMAVIREAYEESGHHIRVVSVSLASHETRQTMPEGRTDRELVHELGHTEPFAVQQKDSNGLLKADAALTSEDDREICRRAIEIVEKEEEFGRLEF